MLTLIQNLYIFILTPIARLTGKMDDGVRNICLQIVIILYPIHFFLFYSYPKLGFPKFGWEKWILVVQISGCFLLLLLIFFSLDRIPKRIEWNKWILYPFIICGLLMLLISFLHPVGPGYRIFAVMIVIMYPCLFFVWNNRSDYESLYDPLARALSVICLFVYFYCFFIAARGDFSIINGRCAGPITNSNLFCFFGVFGSCGAIYLLIKNYHSWLRYLFYSVSIGCGYAIIWMGESRTSFLACTACLVIAMFFFIRYSDKKTTLEYLLKVFLTIVIVLFTIIMATLWVDIQKSAEELESQQITSTTSDASATTEAPDPSATSEASDVPAEHSETTDSQGGESLFDRLFSGSYNTSTYSSSRLLIWRGYAQFFNLTGNNVAEADWDALSPIQEKRPHNNFFDMAFRFGVPIGILFILIELIACVKALQLLFTNRKRETVLLFPVLLIAIFFVFSMFEIAVIPFEREAPCYYYLALILLVDAKYAS